MKCEIYLMDEDTILGSLTTYLIPDGQGSLLAAGPLQILGIVDGESECVAIYLEDLGLTKEVVFPSIIVRAGSTTTLQFSDNVVLRDTGA